MIKVYFDGAAHLKEKAAWAYLIKDGDIWLTQDYGLVPCPAERATCNVGEHYALYKALGWLLENQKQGEQIKVHGDSKLVIYQIFRHWKIKNPDLPYAQYAEANRRRIESFPNITGKLLPREYNQNADDLSKIAMEQL